MEFGVFVPQLLLACLVGAGGLCVTALWRIGARLDKMSIDLAKMSSKLLEQERRLTVVEIGCKYDGQKIGIQQRAH